LEGFVTEKLESEIFGVDIEAGFGGLQGIVVFAELELGAGFEGPKAVIGGWGVEIDGWEEVNGGDINGGAGGGGDGGGRERFGAGVDTFGVFASEEEFLGVIKV
jgi:hypothetical protein